MMSRKPTPERGAAPQESVRALLILNYDVRDRERLLRYREDASEILRGHGAMLIASTSETGSLSEAEDAGTDTVILGFDSRAAAEATYYSPSYHALVGERLAATTPRCGFIVDVTTHLWAAQIHDEAPDPTS
jgi:uncharacterized protein (DUF1330 family)